MSWGWLIIFGLILVVVGTTAWGAWRAAPYLPMPSRDVDRLLRLAELKTKDLMIDLGAGDGRLIITAVKNYPVTAIGYEIALVPFLIAWWRLRYRRLRSRAKIRYQDFFSADLSRASVVTCFLTPRAMKKLGPIISRQLSSGTAVLSYAFPIPGWTPTRIDKPSQTEISIYRYDLPACLPT